MKRFVLIVSHGSREKSANREFKQIVRRYQKRHPQWKVSHAFLELVTPSIPQGLGAMAQKAEAKTILVLPYFLFAARHVKKDIPAILKAFRQEHPGVKVTLAKPFGSDPKLLDVLDQRTGEVS